MNRKTQTLTLALVAALAAISGLAQQKQTPQTPSPQMQSPQSPQMPQSPQPGTPSAGAPQEASAGMAKGNLVETATAAGNFTKLAMALDAAGLTDTLKSGSYTVFAPTDEAFAKIPSDQLNALMADKEKLRRVLLYHIVNGKVMASEVMGMKDAKTLEGSSLKVKTDGNKTMVGTATLVQTDIPATNGVIHVIDTVLMP